MWIKTYNDITKYIPEDNKFHDVQIINDAIYVDGKLKSAPSFFSEIKILSKVLSDKEIETLADNNILEPTNTTEPKTKSR